MISQFNAVFLSFKLNLFSFSKFDMITYVTGYQSLTPQRTDCKISYLTQLEIHFKIEYVCKFPTDGEQNHSQSSVYIVQMQCTLAYEKISM